MKPDPYLHLDGKTFGNSLAVHDVFYNKFSFNDATDYCTYPTTMTVHPAEVAHGIVIDKNDTSVLYHLNQNGFRCDDFKTNHKDTHILFAGCSETEGVGGNLDSCWAHMLYEDLSKHNKLSGYFNIAKSGFGWQKIISNCLIYFDQIGIPDYLFVMLPDVNRFFRWEREIQSWTYIQDYTLDFEIHQQKMIDFIVSWKLFVKFCKEKNIELLFATWDQLNVSYINHCNFNNFIEIEYSNEAIEDLIDKKLFSNDDKKSIFFEKRDGHQGYGKHFMWKDAFLNTIGEKKYENLAIS
jgi:hypothetical protein